VRGVLVCAATRAEADACRRGIAAAGRLAHEVLVTGVGPRRAAQSLGARLARGAHPALVVSSGFAGALSPTLGVSSWITGIRLSEWSGVVRVPVEGVALVEGPAGLVRCEVLSSSALALASTTTPDDLAPLAVDMESAALARAAGRNGIAFAVVRMISDTPTHPLPAFLLPVAAALSATTLASRLAFTGWALCGAAANPRGVVRLVRESSAWLRDLEEGWRRLGPWPAL
jgi:hypothetical protein